MRYFEKREKFRIRAKHSINPPRRLQARRFCFGGAGLIGTGLSTGARKIEVPRMVAIDQDKAAAPGFVSRERLLCLENILSSARFLAHGLGEPVGGNRMGYYFIILI